MIPMEIPQFDPNNPMEALMQMQAMGMAFPPMQGYAQPGYGGRNQRGQPRKRGRCRDFDNKGFCARGNTCMYDHGDESVFVAPSGPGNEGMTGQLTPYKFSADTHLQNTIPLMPACQCFRLRRTAGLSTSIPM